ncbi:MAG: PQQ-binding-like beta-propeller repeat protein [Spirochaetota bacterium]
MKRFLLCFLLHTLVYSLLFLPPAHGQERLPEYQVEVLNEVDSLEGTFFSFVFKGFLYLFSLEARKPLWRVFIGGDLVNPFQVGEQVYFYDIYNRMYAVTREGRKLWVTEVEHEIKGKPAVYGDVLIIATHGGGIYLLDSSDGQVLFSGGGNAEISAGVRVIGDLLVTTFKEGRLVAYRLPEGSRSWEYNAGGIVSVAPVAEDGSLYVGSWDSMFYALDLEEGALEWKSFVGESVTREFLVIGDWIVLFFSRGEMVCLDRRSGDIEWVKVVDDVEYNYNYFNSTDTLFILTPGLLAIDPRNGSVLFRYRERAFQLYKDMLFDNMVEGLRPLTEQDRQRLLEEVYFTVEAFPSLPPEHAGEHLVYFVAENAYLYVYDARKNMFVLRYSLL